MVKASRIRRKNQKKLHTKQKVKKSIWVEKATAFDAKTLNSQESECLSWLFLFCSFQTFTVKKAESPNQPPFLTIIGKEKNPYGECFKDSKESYFPHHPVSSACVRRLIELHFSTRDWTSETHPREWKGIKIWRLCGISTRKGKKQKGVELWKWF